MAEAGIPENVHQLIASSLDSVAEMEALLLLRAEPSKAWSSDEAAQRLYISPAEADKCLRALVARGLLKEESGFRYAPATPELSQAVEDLAETYRTRLIPITRLIHSKSAKTSNVQLFADVFRFRKDG